MSSELDRLWGLLRPDTKGLVTAVVQHADTGQVLMVGHMNRDSLAATLQTRRVTFWSRSRGALWEKGEQSGNTLDLHELRVDCDGDAVLAKAQPRGPTCHTGTTSCFYRRVWTAGEGPHQPVADDGPEAPPAAVLHQVFEVILQRKARQGMTNRQGRSYVRSLLDAGPDKIGAKLEEEAAELVQAIRSESGERVGSEAADLLFHALVGLAHRDLDWTAITDVLEQRFGRSGIDEKAARRGSS